MELIPPLILAKLEALLYYHGDPIPLSKLGSLVGLSGEDCARAVAQLERMCALDTARGLMVVRHGDTVQLVTKPSCREVGDALVRDEFREELSPAGLEVLSLIAYLGPVPRATVDYIRGVNSSFTVRNLVVRGLVEKDSQASRGNVYAYRASAAFLSHMGLSKISELPEYGTYREKFEAFQNTPTDQDVKQDLSQS